MSEGAFPVVIFHDVATEVEMSYMKKQASLQVRLFAVLKGSRLFGAKLAERIPN